MDKDIMTFTQSIEQVGINKGVDKGILSTAKNLLKYGALVELVKKVQDLMMLKLKN